MLMHIRPLLPLAAMLALAACGGDAPAAQAGDDNRSAEGEILGGSISDEMLPLERLQSQSPTLKDAPARVGDSSGADAGSPVEGNTAEDDAGDGTAGAQPVSDAPTQTGPAQPETEPAPSE